MYDFLVLLAYLISILFCFQKINTRGNAGWGRVGEAAGDNQVPPQAPTAGVAMPVNPAGLTDSGVRTSLALMAQDITVHSQAMKV